MEIRNNSFDHAPRRLPKADITLRNRDAIDRATPEPAPPADGGDEGSERSGISAKRIKNARDEYRARHPEDGTDRGATLKRIKNARDEYRARQPQDEAAPTGTESDAGPSLKRIKNARAAHRARQGDAMREAIKAARDEYRANNPQPQVEGRRIGSGQSDAVQLSDQARKMLAETGFRPTLPDQASDRAKEVQELKARHESGTLNTDELIARAAFRMLAGE